MKKVTRQWVRKAEHDIAAAKHLLSLKPTLSDEICFHSQQAIEKFLKSILCEHGQPIQKTHDLTVLLAQLLPVDPRFRSLGRGLKSISRYAVEYRYPGLNTSARQARAAFSKALVVKDAVRKHLGLPVR
jgi:HEPN domain-containing protein